MAPLKRIHQMPAADRPREKMLRKGVAALSVFELWEAYIGNGSGAANVGYIARQLQRLVESGGSEALTFENLITIRGVSKATACKIMAAFELARRQLAYDYTPLRTQADVLARVADIRSKQQEYLVALSLDGGQRLIALRTIAIGTLDSVIVHPREVFADAVADRAASVVVAHNHPSGDVLPSRNDISLTQQLAAAGQLLGIALRDHLIVGRNDHFSFQQHHLL